MRTRIKRISTIGIVVFAFSGTANAQREILRLPGVSLESQIKAGETQLTVLYDRDPPTTILPATGQSELDANLQFASAVFVVRVVSAPAQLTAERDWITTRIHAEIDSVLKHSGNARVGDAIDFTQPGGTLAFGNCRVTAIVREERPIAVNRRYLLFAAVDGVTGRLAPTQLYEELPNGKLLAVSRVRMDLVSGISGSSVEQIASKLKSKAPQRIH